MKRNILVLLTIIVLISCAPTPRSMDEVIGTPPPDTAVTSSGKWNSACE